jgi:hypothetical protein
MLVDIAPTEHSSVTNKSRRALVRTAHQTKSPPETASVGARWQRGQSAFFPQYGLPGPRQTPMPLRFVPLACAGGPAPHSSARRRRLLVASVSKLRELQKWQRDEKKEHCNDRNVTRRRRTLRHKRGPKIFGVPHAWREIQLLRSGGSKTAELRRPRRTVFECVGASVLVRGREKESKKVCFIISSCAPDAAACLSHTSSL